MDLDLRTLRYFVAVADASGPLLASAQAVRRRVTAAARGIVTRSHYNDENHDLVEVVEGIVDQFRETLPIIDLNLTLEQNNHFCTLLN